MLPQIYFFIFTNLRHIHREQILCKSISSSREATRNYTIFWLLLKYLLFLCFVFFPVIHLYLFLLIFDIFGGTYVRSNFVHLRLFWRYSRTHESLRLHFLKKRSDASRTRVRAFTLCTGHSR